MMRKDYRVLAKHIDTLGGGIQEHGGHILRLNFPRWVGSLADTLKEDNPKFDRKRFFEACNVDDIEPIT